MFSKYEYPWEILPNLKAIIRAIAEKGIDGYELIDDGILAGKDAVIDESAHVDAPAIIGRGSSIRHAAYLRGSVIIGEGCVVGNCSEIKNSVLMDGAQVPHFNYVGDSVLGEGAHLGAGAICSNLRTDKKSVIIKSAEYKVETSLKKLGAVLGDRVEIGCGAVLCPGTVVGRDSAVYPLTMARGIYPADCIVKRDGSVTLK